MKINIYQAYYQESQKVHLFPNVIPFDNTVNEFPELREYPLMKKVADLARKDQANYWGLISWKFKQKIGQDDNIIQNMINKNPGHDVYFVNAAPIIESFFANPWYHGEWHHKGIMDIASDGLDRMGFTGNIIVSALYPRNKVMYANYIIGNDKFWTEMFQFIDTFFGVASHDTELKAKIWSPAGYSGDPKLSYFIFLVERLIPTFLVLFANKISAYGYEYTHSDFGLKYKIPITDKEFERIKFQSDFKQHIFNYPNPELLDSWIRYNKFMLREHNKLLYLE